MTRSATILLITPGFPADESDENCIPPLQAFLRNLGEEHPEITIQVIALHYPYTLQPYVWHGIKVYPMRGNNVRYPARLFFLNRVKLALRKLRKEHAFTKVHALWWGEAALLGRWFSKRFHVPLIITLMGQDALPRNRYLKLVKARSAKVIALSDFQALTFNQSANRAVDEVVAWGIDPTESQEPMGHRPIDVLAVGSLIPLKQYELFIEAIAKLKQDYPAIKAAIIGSGPERETLREMIEKKRLAGNIELRGERPRAETLATMRQARIFLHPSRYESLGYASLEALAAGCTVVSLPTGIAKPGDHWFVAKNPGELVDLVSIALEQNHEANRISVIPYPVNETTAAYARLYTQ